MKLEEPIIVELLKIMEVEDQGDGVSFSDHQFVQENNYSGQLKDEFLGNRNLDEKCRYHLDKMVQRGYLDEIEKCDDGSTYGLTSYGHAVLAEIRESVWYKRLWRAVARWMDKAMTSIVLPMVVSVLTVLMLKYLGLSGN